MPEKKSKHEEGKKSERKEKMHLHEMRIVQNHDGSLTHHHYYKKHPDDAGHYMIREHAASSATPEDAGQHVEDQFSMNQMGAQPQGEPDGDENEQGGEPAGPEEQPGEE